MRRPVIAAGVVVVALAGLAIPALDVRLGLPNDGTAQPGTTHRQAYDLVSEGFGVGVNGQLTIVAQIEGGDPRPPPTRPPSASRRCPTSPPSRPPRSSRARTSR